MLCCHPKRITSHVKPRIHKPPGCLIGEYHSTSPAYPALRFWRPRSTLPVLVVFDIRNSPRPLGYTGTFRDVENLLDRITSDHNLLLDKRVGYGWIMMDIWLLYVAIKYVLSSQFMRFIAIGYGPCTKPRPEPRVSSAAECLLGHNP